MSADSETLQIGNHANSETRRLSAAEAMQLLLTWNSTNADFPRDETIASLFEKQAQAAPDAIAVVFQSQRITYEALNNRANQIAAALIQQGAGPEKIVGVCAERSPEMIAGILGVLKSGAAYLPLDPNYPAERLEFMIADANPAALLVQPQHAARFSNVKCAGLELDAKFERVTHCENPRADVAPENLAYVIYTSGSTGKPKGTLITHRNLVHSTSARFEYYKEELKSFLLLPSFAFDSSVAPIFWTLSRGAALVIPQEGAQQDPLLLTELIELHGVTHILALPSLYNAILEAAEPARLDTLRAVVVAGETCSGEIVQRHFRKNPNCSLHNEYGPTECSVWSTVYKCSAADGAPPIGKPIRNAQVFLLDEEHKPVPLLTPGELFIGGEGVARGYLNRPELTSERFIRHPFSKDETARLYRTGDLARFRADGNIEFLGRGDRQIKIRGYRVELGEIEEVLAGHPGVREAAVVARGDSGHIRLLAYVTPRGANIPERELRDFAAQKLPAHMLPAAWIELKEMPRTPNGKIDRNALPEEVETPKTISTFNNELECYIADLWRGLLKREPARHDKFFEIGGDSIRAAHFITRISKEIGEFIYVVKLFEAPSVGEFAEFLQRDYAEAVAKRFPSLPAAAAPAVEHAHITEDTIEELRRSIPSVGTIRRSGTKNLRAMFILSPPRSGTTLLRVMFAGHPDLFSAAELQLLGFNTMKERREAFSGKNKIWLEGAIRAVMELRNCDAEAAIKIIDSCEEQDISTQDFYSVLQQWIHPRMLVDKSPSYVFDYAALQKAENDFEQPLYVHLVRHPYAMVRSFEKLHMDQALFLRPHRFTARQLAEMLWVISHRNTLRFLSEIPAQRKFRMTFEDLTAQPERVVTSMCEALELPFHADILQPYKNLDRKMTDGIYDVSTPMGDEHFLQHKKIDASVADAWQKVQQDNFLSDITWDLAAEFGYQRPASTGSASSSKPAARDRLARQRQLRETNRS